MALRYQNLGYRSRFASESSLVFSFKRPSDHYKWVSESEFPFKRVDQAQAKLRFLKEFFRWHCDIKIWGTEADSPVSLHSFFRSKGRVITINGFRNQSSRLKGLTRLRPSSDS